METFSRGTLDPWYVTGFVEGEGTFTYSRNGRNMALYFAIKLSADDRGLLEDIQRYFDGIGKIYKVRPSVANVRTRSGWTKEASYFRVTRMDELPAVVNHFSRYPLRGSKARAYEIWLEMLLAKQRFRKPELDRLSRLALNLSERAVRNRPWHEAESDDGDGANRGDPNQESDPTEA